jgi:hypothetical protein
MKSARILAVALLCALTLTSCKPPGGDLPPIPEDIPKPAETSSSVVIDVPRSILDLPCSVLLDEAWLSRLFSSAIAPVEPAETISGVDHVIPYTFAVQQLGGLACETSNGQPQSAKVTLSPDYRGVLLTLLPITAKQAAQISEFPQGQSYCTDDPMPYCQADSFELEGWWLSVTR